MRRDDVIWGPACRSLDTSVLDALAVGGELNDSSLDFMIGEPFPNKADAPAKLRSPSTDEQHGNGTLLSHRCVWMLSGVLNRWPAPAACSGQRCLDGRTIACAKPMTRCKSEPLLCRDRSAA